MYQLTDSPQFESDDIFQNLRIYVNNKIEKTFQKLMTINCNHLSPYINSSTII